ncbi:glycosyltransferase [Halobacillus litoralis]|uniref:Glycosyltransferase n=1 Tax=Halobacillus litoralis TaxID=45668 RepID=A0A845E3B0_9BACI|nr:glycosyltransferase [Halobacillus litoralis]MYL49173.1 glycosyltransferase [Halobacillus litoralis]
MLPFLSVCMIVKNEDKVLKRCLNSIEGIADEIIIVDTGSVDNTKKIALRYSDKVYDYNWENDFSKARNFAATKANGKWILAIDADEFVDRESFKAFKENLKSRTTKENILLVQIVNFVGENGGGTSFNFHERIYKNNGRINYYRNIHELLRHDNKMEVRGESELQIFHSGYLSNTVRGKGKSERNLRLLNAIKEKEGIDYYFLGNEYYAKRDFERAIVNYKKGYQLKENINVEWVPRLLVRLINSLLYLDRISESIIVAQTSADLYPGLVDFNYLIAKINMANGKELEAINILENIIQKKDVLISYSSSDFAEYLPHKHLGSLYEKIDNSQLAVHHYSKALSLNDFDDYVWMRLIYLISEHSTMKDLNDFINDNCVDRNSMNTIRLLKILLKVPNFKVQNLSTFYLNDPNLTKIQNEALTLKNLLINGKDSEVITKIYDMSFNQFASVLGSGLFNIEDLILLILETNEKKLKEIIAHLEASESITNLLNFLFDIENKRLSAFEERLFISIYKLANVLHRKKIVNILDNKKNTLPLNFKIKIDEETVFFLKGIKKSGKDALVSSDDMKGKVEKLINKGHFDKAKMLIRKYKEQFHGDAETVSMESIIAITERDYEYAEQILVKGLEYEDNLDLMYNLGYLFERTGDIDKAFIYYNRALIRCEKGKLQEEIREAINNVILKRPDLDQKKVLLVAYAFPPIGGPGVQRTLKFAKYLRDNGWSPIVLTVGNTAWDLKDTSLLHEIDESIDVIRVDDIKPHDIDNHVIKQVMTMYKELINDDDLFKEYIQTINNQGNLNELLFIPEYQSVWANKVINNIQSYLNIEEIDLVYTSADPNADNFIGYYLKKIYNKPWVADFRDAWTQNPYTDYVKEGIKYKIECCMERNLVRFADRLVTVSEVISADFINNLGLDKNNVETITNGYDEYDFKNIATDKEEHDFFTITHNGLFYQKRSPVTFLKAIKSIIDNRLIPVNKIKVYFTRKDNWVEYVKQLGLDEVVEFTGYMNHSDSLELAIKSDLLLLIVGAGEENKGIYPGKIFEYLRLRKPMLALSPKGSVVENLVGKLDRGRNIHFDDIQEIENYIVNQFNNWKTNKTTFLNLSDDIENFERKKLTTKLSEVFNDVLEKGVQLSNFNEKDHIYYDAMYKTGGWNKTYFKHYSEIHYYEVWKKALAIINDIKKPTIIDIGCGPGQFANLLLDNDVHRYLGFDFSEEAIAIAKEVNSNYKELFTVDNAYTSRVLSGNYNTVVLFEVLEHINDDLKIISKVKSNSNVLLSVPNFYSESHVRWFSSEMEVRERYENLIEIKEIQSFSLNESNKIFLLHGIKKKF